MESFITILFTVVGFYLLAGILFSLIFFWKGLKTVDPGTEGTGFFLKVLLFPGMVVFWIAFLIKWIKARRV